MEYFEITFFPIKSEENYELIERIQKLLKDCQSFGKSIIIQDFSGIISATERGDNNDDEILLQFFREEEQNFDEICISLPEYHFTKDNFYENISTLTAFVEKVFLENSQLTFATGIYELTYDYIENLKNINEFDEKILRNFPLVFCSNASRKREKAIYMSEKIACFYNENAQNIF